MNSNFQRLLVILSLLMCWVPAHAYIDPGTGSALIGAIVAAFAAVVAFVKLYWHRLLGMFSRNKSKDDSTKQDFETDEQ